MTQWPTIVKARPRDDLLPNLQDYAAERAAFSWDAARARLDGLPGGGLNIAHEAVDRHARGQLASTTAIRLLSAGGQTDVSYAELAGLTARFANVLAGLGIKPGERVYTLAGRILPLYVTALGTLKYGAVYCPLFSAFGPEPIQARMAIGSARVLLTTAALYRRKIAGIRERLPGLRHVLITDRGAGIPDTLDFHELMERASPLFTIPPTDPEQLALLHFTSGTTGRPKGVMHVHAAVVAHDVTGRLALDLKTGDICWCTADPGWVTGVSYGIIAPLTNGVTLLVDEDEFDAEHWYRILADQEVTVWYTAPTAIRMLMKYGDELPHRFDLSRLRFMASVGEPLNPEAIAWSQRVLGLPFHDNWWQSETGGIMIANYATMDIRPGSMGKPLPGIDAAVARRLEDGTVELLEAPDTEGELVLRPGWPSMFRGYLNDEERYRQCFAGGWYFTGDVVRRDRDGYFWFVGRADDVIKSAGHLISPFEVESTLLEHPAVAEAAVIGLPDAVAFETVKAYVALKPGHEPGEDLRHELLGFCRKRLGVAVAPRAIDFRAELPRTRSGKIMRRVLKARELGLPEGDLSTLEAGA